MFGMFIFSSLVVLCSIIVLTRGDGCNEFVCGSVVSKCLLTQSCQCKLSDCYCCNDCLHCLGELYTECCSCLDLCPKHNETFNALAPKSEIGDFEGVPELFDTLTAEEDDDQWTVIRFPMNNGLQRHYNMATGSFGFGSPRPDHDALQVPTGVNCTVMYLNVCTTNKKCSQDCESMGSNSYRWFHDGCCECVGANCYNYGLNDSRCTACPEDEDEDEMLDSMDDAVDYGETEDTSWDYGEEEINYN